MFLRNCQRRAHRRFVVGRWEVGEERKPRWILILGYVSVCGALVWSSCTHRLSFPVIVKRSRRGGTRVNSAYSADVNQKFASVHLTHLRKDRLRAYTLRRKCLSVNECTTQTNLLKRDRSTSNIHFQSARK